MSEAEIDTYAEMENAFDETPSVPRMPDHDPRALRAFALIAEREHDADVARALRAAAKEIDRLRCALIRTHVHAGTPHRPFGE